MRRRALSPVAGALDALTDRLAPPTVLAEVQRAWAQAAPAFAEHGEPWSERDGEILVACPEAVWAQELDLLSERVVAALNEAIGRPVVRRLRPQSAPARF